MGVPQGTGSTGPCAAPGGAQMGTQEGSGCSVDVSWEHTAVSPGHLKEKGGCEAALCSPELMLWGQLSGKRQPGDLE